MAEHKVVNTTQLESDLTSIANAIREKSGASGSLVFPDGFAEAIASIASLPSGFSALTSGTFTPSSSVSTYTFEHGLGVKPNFYVIFPETTYTETKYNIYMILCSQKGLIDSDGTMYPYLYVYVYFNSYMQGTMSRTMDESYLGVINDVTITTRQQGSYVFQSGTTYRWMCGVTDGN